MFVGTSQKSMKVSGQRGSPKMVTLVRNGLKLQTSQLTAMIMS